MIKKDKMINDKDKNKFEGYKEGVEMYNIGLSGQEKKLIKEQLDYVDDYVSGNSDLNMVFERYILTTRTDLRNSTYTNYMYMYDHFVRDSFGKRKIGDIKYSDVLEFYQYFLKEMDLKVITLEIIHAILHPTFQFAVQEGIIRNNPSDNVIKKIKKTSRKSKAVSHALTLEQEKVFLQYIRDNEVFNHWEAILTFLLGTGCRISETIGLRWEDIDFEKCFININHSVTYCSRNNNTKKSGFKVTPLKVESRIRTIPISDKVYNVLKEEYEVQEMFGFCEVVLDDMSGFIFKNLYGGLIKPRIVTSAIRRIIKAYNADEVLKAEHEKREAILLPYFSCYNMRQNYILNLKR